MQHEPGLSRRLTINAAIKYYTQKSIHKLSKIIGIPKSSVYRENTNRTKRTEAVGHSFFETEQGLLFLARLMICVITIFGIKCHVGAESMSLFFKYMLLSGYVACSPSKLREIKNIIRKHIEIYGDEELTKVVNLCQTKDLCLGGDETEINDKMVLLMMELQSGFIFTEVLSDNRTKDTWWKNVGGLLGTFKNILSFTCDGAGALMNIAKKVACDCINDMFHGLQDIVKVFRAKFHAKTKSYISKLSKLIDKPLADSKEQDAAIKNIKASIKTLEKGEKDYRNALFTVSTQNHPFCGVCTPQSSGDLEEKLNDIHKTLVQIAKDCDITDKYKLLARFKRRISKIAILCDSWWSWATMSANCITEDPELLKWMLETVLPYFYWKNQLKKSKRKPSMRAHYEDLLDKARQQLQEHRLTEVHLTDIVINWAISMSNKYQRTSSQVEGRNGRLSQAYFNARGLLPEHLKSLTVLHNFFITREDGTTASERLCNHKPPDLIEHLVDALGTSVLASPRARLPQKHLLA